MDDQVDSVLKMAAGCSFLAILLCIGIVLAQDSTVRFMTIMDGQQPNLPSAFGRGLGVAQEKRKSSSRLIFDQDSVIYREDKEEESFQSACQSLNRGVSVVVDLTWGGWKQVRDVAKTHGIPYVRLESSIRPFVRAADRYLRERAALDAALIFQSEMELDQSLHYLIGNSIIRVLLLNRLNINTTKNLSELRPAPSFYVLFSDTPDMTEIFNLAMKSKLVVKVHRWMLVFMDFLHDEFRLQRLEANITTFALPKRLCCEILQSPTKNCDCNFNIAEEFVKSSTDLLADVSEGLMSKGVNLPVKSVSCNNNKSVAESEDRAQSFLDELEQGVQSHYKYFWWDKSEVLLSPDLFMEVTMISNGTDTEVGNWSQKTGFKYNPEHNYTKIKRKFRVGINEISPWTVKTKSDSGEVEYQGYCIDLLNQLAQKLDFDYELVIPEDKQYGEKINGTWNGLVADLEKGETDIVIAALTMTSEREEVIDFVAPYFAQAGITIVMRRPFRNTSLFKFMTVLKLEVWLSILGALIVTGVMLWFLDKYSPYSAQNNKEAYPYPCREFTLKESFWFALTSFTPQGGGEAPKALSGRTLVAAYWLFVVLMLATFTANLAAFLTVERMQSPVQSLEQLARQSKINYTVVNNSWYHEYFKNMANAEEALYQVWKNLTLSTNEQTKFRVWDYPIKEQYTHILKVIEESEPVKDAADGFRRVEENENGDFAFIHDSSEVRYMVYTNCNFTEVGQTFAEQPYAIAVQQGSHLQEEISKVILDLQKDRYFETLASRYWNTTLKAECSSLYDNEGITLQSLGGVFIATLFGLALAMITLAGEVFLYRRKNRKNVRTDVTRVVPYNPTEQAKEDFRHVSLIKFNSHAFHQ